MSMQMILQICDFKVNVMLSRDNVGTLSAPILQGAQLLCSGYWVVATWPFAVVLSQSFD